MKLSDTAEMMCSEDYKERFKAEYYQLHIRYKKLKEMVDKWDKGELDFKPTCPRHMYEQQLHAMALYYAVLAVRAGRENITFDEWKNEQELECE